MHGKSFVFLSFFLFFIFILISFLITNKRIRGLLRREILRPYMLFAFVKEGGGR